MIYLYIRDRTDGIIAVSAINPLTFILKESPEEGTADIDKWSKMSV